METSVRVLHDGLPMYTAKGKPVEGSENYTYVYFTVEANVYRDFGEDIAPVLHDREEMKSTECVLCLPNTYSETGEKTPLILFAHGSGGIVSYDTRRIGGVDKMMTCVEGGYAVLDVHGLADDGRDYGNYAVVCALYRAYRYAVAHYNLTERVFIGGASMGGLTSMNFLNAFPAVVTAVGLFYPRLALGPTVIDGVEHKGSFQRAVTFEDGKTIQQKIADEYHYTDATKFDLERSIGFEPNLARTITYPDGTRATFVPCPIKIWHGNADQTIDWELSADFIRAVRRGGCWGEFRLVDGIGHKTNEAMKTEILYWFNRFR